MYDDIKELLTQYNNKKLFVDEDFVNALCEIIRDNRKLNNLINNWYFDPEMKAFGEYNSNNSCIRFNLQSDGYVHSKEIHPDYPYLFYNFEVLMGIFHEFAHVDQLKKMNEIFDCGDIKEYLKKNDNLIETIILYLSMNYSINYPNDLLFKIIKRIQFSYYCHNHDNDPIEREADIKSAKEAKIIIDKMEDDEETELLKKYINLIRNIDFISGYKLKGNTTNNLCLSYFLHKPFFQEKDFLKQIIPLFQNLNTPLYTRILYGLPLTRNEYINLNIDCIDAGKIFKKSILK